MTKITNIDILSVGADIFDENGELCHILKIITKEDILENMIEVQHYPSSKWYKIEVKCDKCGGTSILTHTATIQEKLICIHKVTGIPKNQLFPVEKHYTCGGKKYTEIKRRNTGIPCVGIYACGDFIKKFKLP